MLNLLLDLEANQASPEVLLVFKIHNFSIVYIIVPMKIKVCLIDCSHPQICFFVSTKVLHNQTLFTGGTASLKL